MSDETYLCPGPCNRAWETAERIHHETGQPNQLTPNPGRPIWCPNCQDTINTHLLNTPKLVNNLGHGKLNTLAADLGRTSHPDPHASPSPAHDLADEITRWTKRMEDETRTHLGHPPATGRRTINSAVAYLTGHLTPILNRDPDGIDFGATINTNHRRLLTATGYGQLTHRIPGQCLHCNRRGTLNRQNGEDLVKCRHCGASWDYEHYGFLARAASQGKPTKETA